MKETLIYAQCYFLAFMRLGTRVKQNSKLTHLL